MNNPKVLIYMPCYNHEKYVNEAIDSIINQTYENWELYVVNDGSTDNSASVIASYRDSRVHFIDFKENTALIGVSLFLHNYLKDIDAKYIAGTASDDKWELDKLEKQVKFLETHKEYKACFTWDKLIFNNERDIYNNMSDYSHEANKSRYEWLRRYFYLGNCMNACSCLLHKDVYYELGGMNQCFRQLADFRLWIKLVFKYPIYILEEELTYYRRHDTNISCPTLTVNVRDRNEAYNIWMEIFREIDRETFRRTFYKEIAHMSWDSDEAFEAEKFVLLLNETGNRVYESMAINIYLDNCSNQKFLEILEKDYDYLPKDFLRLSGNGGMIYNLIRNPNEYGVEPPCEKRLSPAYVLMNALDNRKLEMNTLNQYMYSNLIDLFRCTGWGANSEQLCMYIAQLREKLINSKKEKVVFILQGEESQFDYKTELKEYLNDDMKCYYGRVLDRRQLAENEDADCSICYGEEKISLVEAGQRCMRFLYNAEVMPDIVYYIDCVDDNFDCLELIAEYPLSVEQNCIVRDEVYQVLQETSNEYFLVCNAVFTY